MKSTNEWLEYFAFLQGKEIALSINQTVTVKEVVDYIEEDRSVGIFSGYAVVVDDTGKDYVIFDNGEVQDGDSGETLTTIEPIYDKYAGYDWERDLEYEED